MRIIIIGGNKVLSRLYRDALERAGYSVVTTEDGTMAWSRQFDLIICNLELPGDEQGNIVARQMRDRGIRLPFILMSEDHKNLERIGRPLVATGIVRGLIETPVSAATMVNEVERIFNP